jgi:hypothetical protein
MRRRRSHLSGPGIPCNPQCPILCSLPMPYAGMWQAGPTLERRHQSTLLVHLRSNVHENERIGHLTLASIGAKYCANCGQLMSVLGRNHRCERHLGSQPQLSSPAPMTPTALLAPAPRTANTALGNCQPWPYIYLSYR